MAGTSNIRHSDIVRIDLERKVLEGVRVADSLARIGLSERKDTRVLRCIAVVFDDALTDIRDVQKAVQKIGGPIEVGGAVGDVVAEHAHALQWTAENVGAVADDGFGGGVGATPVTGPVCSHCQSSGDGKWSGDLLF